MQFVNDEILNYSIDHSSVPSDICKDLENETRDGHPLARMLCGPLEASLLGSLIRFGKVKRILELGTFTGYSALSMAEQLPEDGEIITLDCNGQLREFQDKYFNRSPHGKKVIPKIGRALELMDELEGAFDLIFIDADKGNYLNYLNKGLELLNPSGLIVVDNVLWSGKVTDPEENSDETTRAIVKLNEFVASEDSLFATLLPIRDGVYLIQKKY